jgi:glycolate oxidase iron-sulfur subunit
METHLADWLEGTPDGIEAEAILRRCVHCGFCTATCPTYQLLGDERDGPRGRIYLMKSVFEGEEPTRATQLHLDRCLTCRNCETTCPSGVEYGRLVDIGRRHVAARVERPLGERLLRSALREGLTRRWLFDPAMRIGKLVRPLLPSVLRSKVPAALPAGEWPTREHARKVLLPEGCVQPAMMPNIDAATARVLDALGVQALRVRDSGCCGAIRLHLDDESGAQAQARANIDAWWPHLDEVEAILVNASGCGVMVKDYGHLLRHDPAYAERAERVAGLARDPAQWLPEALAAADLSIARDDRPLAFHPPCTLQHGQRIRGAVEGLLQSLGARLVPVADSHLCCGSAGTYSVTQPALSRELRDRKLAALGERSPAMILSANIGCISHLAGGSAVPVRHWLEWLDERIAAGSAAGGQDD